MRKTIPLIVIAIALIVIFISGHHDASAPSEPSAPAFDAKNSSFSIENMPVQLVNGKHVAELQAIRGAKIETNYYGKDIQGDINNDGKDDHAFFVTQTSGGTGWFFYVILDLASGDGYAPLSTSIIGDRIAPESLEMRDSKLYVNYLDRKPSEAMVTEPTVHTTKVFQLDHSGLSEVK